MQGFVPFLERQNAFFVEELLADPDAHVEVLKRSAISRYYVQLSTHPSFSPAGTLLASP